MGDEKAADYWRDSLLAPDSVIAKWEGSVRDPINACVVCEHLAKLGDPFDIQTDGKGRWRVRVVSENPERLTVLLEGLYEDGVVFDISSWGERWDKWDRETTGARQ